MRETGAQPVSFGFSSESRTCIATDILRASPSVTVEGYTYSTFVYSRAGCSLRQGTGASQRIRRRPYPQRTDRSATVRITALDIVPYPDTYCGLRGNGR